MPLMGLENVHYAELTKDDSTGVTYGNVKKLPGAISVNENVQTNTAKMYADNRLWATAQSAPEGELEIVLADLSLDDYAALCGHTVDSGGKLVENAADVAPYICIMGEFVKDDGKSKRYFKLLKGQCAKIGLNASTKSDNPELQSQTLSATFMPRQYDGNYKYVKDSTTVLSDWYESVE